MRTLCLLFLLPLAACNTAPDAAGTTPTGVGAVSTADPLATRVGLDVLAAGGTDPARVSGFAFGMGMDRLAMMRHGIDDLRWMMSGDPRFLQQF